MDPEVLLSALREEIPAFISGKRLAHTYAVEEECRVLAERFCLHPSLFTEEDGYRLRTAALLHDITKEKTREEQFALCDRYRIPLTDYEKASPNVLHAKTAPAVAQDVINRKFGERIVGDDIADAIRTHTTGSTHMSLMGKLLFLADYIEATRTFEDCVLLRETYYRTLPKPEEGAEALLLHLDRIMIFSFDLTISDLLDSGFLIDPETTAARNALLYAHAADPAFRPIRLNGQTDARG